jgi:hypothetical protein
LTQDRLRPVHGNFPHVVVGEEGLERSVAGEVAIGPLHNHRRVGQVEVAEAPLVVLGPPGHLVLDQGAEAVGAAIGGQVEVVAFARSWTARSNSTSGDTHASTVAI